VTEVLLETGAKEDESGLVGLGGFFRCILVIKLVLRVWGCYKYQRKGEESHLKPRKLLSRAGKK